MSIKYDVLCNGRLIQAVAGGIVTDRDWVEYEVAHAIDERLRPPVCELIRVDADAYRSVAKDGLMGVLPRREELSKRPTPHRCAIVIDPDDVQPRQLGHLYAQMKLLHHPEHVIVFGDAQTARAWLGFEEFDYRDTGVNDAR